MKKFLVTAYLVRVPALTALAVGAALPWLLTTAMFRGLTDLNLWGYFWESWCSALLIAGAMASANLAFLYGDRRLDGTRVPAGKIPLSSTQVWWVLGSGAVVYSFLQYMIFRLSAGGYSPPGHNPVHYLATAAGLALAVATLLFATVLQEWLDSGQEGPYLVIPFDRILKNNGKTRLFTWLNEKDSPLGKWGTSVGDWLFRLVRWLGPGYIDYDDQGKATEMLPGHVLAFTLFLLTLLGYLAIGFVHFEELENMSPGLDNTGFPTLGYVLAAILIGCWLLSGLAFYLDRFRFPLLLFLTLWTMLAGAVPGSPRVSEHTFDTFRRGAGDPPASTVTPRQVFESSPPNIILINAAGGGIQAAAWTTQVLTGLSKQLGAAFDSHVVTISSVSGGSVGTMFYLGTRPCPGQKGQTPEEALDDAEKSSLEAVGWGLVYPDLQRTLLPAWPLGWLTRDRGWALERMLAWRSKVKNVRLTDLNKEKRPDLPALLINATYAGKGEALVFSNMQFPDRDPKLKPMAPGIHGFEEECPKTDIHIEEAVRMSATFSYISPVARPTTCKEGEPLSEYVADGGYYDNLGMASTVSWLRQATAGLSAASLSGRRILIIDIVGFPESPGNPLTRKNWYYQLIAPLDAILNVREAGQIDRDRQEADLLRESKQQGALTSVEFRYRPNADCRDRPPLSWHLTKTERDCVQTAWGNMTEQIGEVTNFLRGLKPADSATLCSYAPCSAADTRAALVGAHTTN